MPQGGPYVPPLTAEVREHGPDEHYVWWETTNAYGSAGFRLSREGAESLAARIKSGEVKVG